MVLHRVMCRKLVDNLELTAGLEELMALFQGSRAEIKVKVMLICNFIDFLGCVWRASVYASCNDLPHSQQEPISTEDSGGFPLRVHNKLNYRD